MGICYKDSKRNLKCLKFMKGYILFFSTGFFSSLLITYYITSTSKIVSIAQIVIWTCNVYDKKQNLVNINVALW